MESVKENKCRNLHEVELLLESYINYTEETKTSTYIEKGWKKTKHTQSSTFPTIRILHIPIMLHKLLAFYKDHIWGISLLINKEEHGKRKALNITQLYIPRISQWKLKKQ